MSNFKPEVITKQMLSKSNHHLWTLIEELAQKENDKNQDFILMSIDFGEDESYVTKVEYHLINRCKKDSCKGCLGSLHFDQAYTLTELLKGLGV